MGRYLILTPATLSVVVEDCPVQVERSLPADGRPGRVRETFWDSRNPPPLLSN